MTIHINVFFRALLILIIIYSGTERTECARVYIESKCEETIWPGIYSPGKDFSGGGFALEPGQTAELTIPGIWFGRIWGRTGCEFDDNGNGTCQTGSCGSSLVCDVEGDMPATVAQFHLNAYMLDFYDVSLLEGFNLPMFVQPVHGKGNCNAAGCDGDLRPSCPSKLAFYNSSNRNRKVIACQNPCQVFNTDEYCCMGVSGNPETCKPTLYSKKLKEVCPAAYSYAYDDDSSSFTCSDADYVVSFCSYRNESESESAHVYAKFNGSNGLLSLICGRWVVHLAMVFMVNLWIIC